MFQHVVWFEGFITKIVFVSRNAGLDISNITRDTVNYDHDDYMRKMQILTKICAN